MIMNKIYSWKLNFERIMRAVECAYERLSESNRLKLNPATTYQRKFSERITQEMTGALGELAVIDFFEIKRKPQINTFHNVADVLEDIEVRSTNYKNGHLILRDNDSPNRKYIFCTVDYDAVRLIGWVNGKDGMVSEYYRSEEKTKSMFKNPKAVRPAWFVPQDALLDMKDLKI
jgi:hypothetical protein